MKVALIRFVVVRVLMFFVVMYGGTYLFNYETKISDEEITIGRVGINPFNFSKYTINLETGKEEIFQFTLVGNSRFIDYERDCQCITLVHVMDDFLVALLSDGRVSYVTGKTIDKIVPYDQASHFFEDALAIRNKFRDKYADIISP